MQHLSQGAARPSPHSFAFSIALCSFLLCRRKWVCTTTTDEEETSAPEVNKSSDGAEADARLIDEGVTARAFKYNTHEWPLMAVGMYGGTDLCGDGFARKAELVLSVCALGRGGRGGGGGGLKLNEQTTTLRQRGTHRSFTHDP